MCAKNWKKIEKWFELLSQALNFFFIFTIAQDLKGSLKFCNVKLFLYSSLEILSR
jgi:hypothetical protein